MRVALAWTLATLTACGSVTRDDDEGTLTDAGRPDANAPDPGAPDAAVSEPARCDINADFGPPQPINIDTEASEEGAFLSTDELTMFFSSTRLSKGVDYDIFMATRPTRDSEVWSDPEPVPGVNTATYERSPAVTGDGLVMYATVFENANYDIAVATRSGPDASFSSLDHLDTINTDANDLVGTILPNRSAIWFASDENGNYDLYQAERLNDRFTNRRLVRGIDINGAAIESNPVVTPDELTLFFASDRGGKRGNDIWMARRINRDIEFDEPSSLESLNTDGTEVPTWISADGCVLYMTRGPLAAYDILVATRPGPPPG